MPEEKQPALKIRRDTTRYIVPLQGLSPSTHTCKHPDKKEEGVVLLLGDDGDAILEMAVYTGSEVNSGYSLLFYRWEAERLAKALLLMAKTMPPGRP